MAAEYILGVDYGAKRVGIALAHQVARLPRPLLTLENGDQLLQQIAAIVDKEQVGLVVVGLPRTMSGAYSAQTERAEAFAAELSKHLSVPVELADETLTSVDAEARLGANYTKAEVDALAAALILERYLAEQQQTERTA